MLRYQIETSRQKLFPSNVSQRAMSIAEDVALPNRKEPAKTKPSFPATYLNEK